MPAFNDIPLSKLTVLAHFSTAAVGAILQLSIGLGEEGTHVVGLRCRLPGAGGAIHGFVPLEGPQAGVLWSDDELNHCPAIDITEMGSIVLHDPAPRTVVMPTVTAGAVYHALDRAGTKFIYLAVKLPNTAAIVGYARLDGGRRGNIETTRDLIYLGKAAVVGLLPVPRTPS